MATAAAIITVETTAERMHDLCVRHMNVRHMGALLGVLLGMSEDRSSVDRHIEAIVEGGTEQWPHGVAELPGVGGIFVSVEGLAILPGRNQGRVTQGRLDRPDHVIAQITLALAGCLGNRSCSGQ